MTPPEGAPREPVNEPDPIEQAWQDLIDNYGERANLSVSEEVRADSRPMTDAECDAPTADAEPPAVWRGTTGPTFDDIDEPFVPPDPGGLPRLEPLSAAGWVGVLVVPALAIALGVLHITPPPLVSAALVIWFLAGFGYLVYTMPTRARRDPGDDGSRL